MPKRRAIPESIDPVGLAAAAIKSHSSSRDDESVQAPYGDLLSDEMQKVGFAFATSDLRLQSSYYRALGLLGICVRESPAGSPMLIEGGPYRGAWLESTATIGAETLSRFFPSVARSTFELFALFLRADGLIPYKILPDLGPSYRQVQMVTPFARSAWIHASINREPNAFLRKMYDAATANDRWLAANRDTRGSGCVEAFCAFDTGHDLSPRFWHVPDSCFMEDPSRFDPYSPLLPYIAPDLTANVYCQRAYLSRIASELGLPDESSEWRSKSVKSLESLICNCWDPEDEFFYDRDREGRFVRVQSDVLLRVLSCEVGDADLFSRACARYLLNTKKFFSRFPFTSIAMDDPRFDSSSGYNTWGGAVNSLTILRAPDAFESHNRPAELAMALGRALVAYSNMKLFGQCMSPYTGEEGFGSGYSPTLLGFVDAIERLVGILPRPDGSLRFSCLPLPHGMCDRAEAATTAYSRRSHGRLFELECGPEGATAYMDGEWLFTCPRGIRVETASDGRLLSLTGMMPRPIKGLLRSPSLPSNCIDFSIGPNEILSLDGSTVESHGATGFIAPVW